MILLGKLFVVATPIGNLQDFSPRAVEILRSVTLIAAEDTRHSGALRKQFDITTPMISYHHHNRSARQQPLLDALAAGDVALISDAGTPAIADPGQEIVAAAMAAGHTVVPIPGPSAAIAAVSASGLVSGPFIFLGFLERKGEARRAAIAKAQATGWPMVLFESPIRLADTLAELSGKIGDIPTVVARELTKIHEEIRHGTLTELASHYVSNPPRGEIVIVVGAADTAPKNIDAHAIARQLLEDGLKPSRAARELAEIAGISSDDAYAIIRSLRIS